MYPPFLDQIHEHCPKAAYIYTKLWRQRDSNFMVYCTKEQIINELGLSWKSFKHDLMLLKKEKTIKFSFSVSDDKVTITLIPPKSAEKVA